MIVKTPMKTYKGKRLESYSSQELIGIIEVVWQMYANTAEETHVAIGYMTQVRSMRRKTHICFALAIGLASLAVIISVLRVVLSNGN